MFPQYPAAVRRSKKNSAMPSRAIRCGAQSARDALSPRNHAPKSAAWIGAVYCSRMTLAAVVILLATTNDRTVHAYATAPPTWSKDHVKDILRKTARIRTAAMALRMPAMDNGGQWIPLIRDPPR